MLTLIIPLFALILQVNGHAIIKGVQEQGTPGACWERMRRFPSALLLVGWLLLACFTGTTSAGYIGSFAKWGLKASKAVILSLSGWVLDPPKSTPVEAATEPSSTFTQAPSMMADRGVDPRHKTVTTGLGLGRSPVLDPEPTTVPPLHQVGAPHRAPVHPALL